VSTGGLFMIVGMLSDRRHTRLISEYGGLKAVMPRFVAAFLLITLSSIALPGMNGFIGEFLILLGGFLWNPTFAAFAASGVILSAVYMLWMFQRVNYGELRNPRNGALPDLTPREWALVVPTIAVAIGMGVFPVVFLRPMEPAVKRTIERVTGRSFAERPAASDSRLALRKDPEARNPNRDPSTTLRVVPSNVEGRTALKPTAASPGAHNRHG
jgi:NADH-quinone oxidoreductase subunit M